ncbi:MAG TPA: UDP-2,3-diacylglucosamine diphosphatase [Kiritimatiellia bacterium]|nr:UDP-2,3-diacylglucosamine diphosphatase [Kiritimatiellia bacterium]HMO99164.1 UDP-2,3-diacylglucosamine diphosphatase [Kiritimatiellia bacterium]HMP98017.1 UDP-2,3-diacylglucosamine diphosphatase [Kiritimatiellia bacterium]
MIAPSAPDTTTYRSIFLSDFHLGTKTARVHDLLDFLRNHDAQFIYLVGDIVDGWQLKKNWFWSQMHNDVIQKLLRKARKGAMIKYIPGNHDAFAREYVGHHFGGIAVAENALHLTADGRMLLVVHGDTFDGVITQSKWLAQLGGTAYEFAIKLNYVFNRIRRRFGYPYWSLSAWLKHKVKNAFTYIDAFERTLAGEAKRHHADGVVCGHIHRASIRECEGVTYYNTGDWVESCTALVEHFDGRMELITWLGDELARPDQAPAKLEAPANRIEAVLAEAARG